MNIIIADILKNKFLFLLILIFSIFLNFFLWNTINKNLNKTSKYFYDVTFEIEINNYISTKNKILQKFPDFKSLMDQSFYNFHRNTPFLNSYNTNKYYYPTGLNFNDLLDNTNWVIETFKIEFINNYKLNNKELNFSDMIVQQKHLKNKLRFYIFNIISNDQKFENSINNSINFINDNFNNSLLEYEKLFSDYAQKEIKLLKEKISHIYFHDKLNIEFLLNINLGSLDQEKIKKIDKDYDIFYENFLNTLDKTYNNFINNFAKFNSIEIKKYKNNSLDYIYYTKNKRPYPLNIKVDFLIFVIFSIFMTLIIFLLLNIYLVSFKRKK